MTQFTNDFKIHPGILVIGFKGQQSTGQEWDPAATGNIQDSGLRYPDLLKGLTSLLLSTSQDESTSGVSSSTSQYSVD